MHKTWQTYRKMRSFNKNLIMIGTCAFYGRQWGRGWGRGRSNLGQNLVSRKCSSWEFLLFREVWWMGGFMSGNGFHTIERKLLCWEHGWAGLPIPAALHIKSEQAYFRKIFNAKCRVHGSHIPESGGGQSITGWRANQSCPVTLAAGGRGKLIADHAYPIL